MDKDRFIKVYSQGTMNISEIWVDRETGVNYHYHTAGNGAGLCVLIDKDGKPVISEEYIDKNVGFKLQEKT